MVALVGAESQNTAMPHAIFSSPQVAGAGYTEKELKEKGIPYTKAVYPYIRTAMGEAIEDRDGFVNLLASKEGKILGCHTIGRAARRNPSRTVILQRHVIRTSVRAMSRAGRSAGGKPRAQSIG